MENNKVRVIIYGQEYVVAGEESREHIMKVANYVDKKMREIEKAFKSTKVSLLAVLAAVNAADEYFGTLDTVSELKEANAQLEKDVEHYVGMWEETKTNFLRHKEETQALTSAKNDAESEIEKVMAKLKETENNFFDLQMENVQMKSELERLKKLMG